MGNKIISDIIIKDVKKIDHHNKIQKVKGICSNVEEIHKKESEDKDYSNYLDERKKNGIKIDVLIEN